jgi:hypothetical protein
VHAHRSRHSTRVNDWVKYRVLTRARCVLSAAALTSTCGLWRWTTSWRRRGRPRCGGARADPKTSTTDKAACSAAMPATATQIQPTSADCKPATPCARRPACSARWREAAAAGERAGALHRRCLPGDAWPQPGNPKAPCGRRVESAPAGVERRSGAAEAAAGELSAHYPTISGWNVGLNSGVAAGQTVFHAHWHLIPPREGDCDEPQGGVQRG